MRTEDGPPERERNERHRHERAADEDAGVLDPRLVRERGQPEGERYRRGLRPARS